MSARFSSSADSRARQEAIQARCVHPTGTFIPFRPDEIEQSIPERFEQQVRRYPGRIAVKTRTQELTYAALNEAANRLARAILACRGEGSEPLPLLLHKELPLVVGSFGALKAGKIRAPLDASLPHDRLAWMLEDLEAGVLVCDHVNMALAHQLAPRGCAIINLDALDSGLSPEDLGLAIPPDAGAQVYYTSGSTGRSKGVVESHRGVLHGVMRQVNSAHICADDRIGLFATGQKGVFRALLNGAALYPVAIQRDGLAHLADWLLQEGITTFTVTPSFFRQFVGTLTGEEGFPRVRLITLGGEAVTARDVELYQRHFSDDCILVHTLASTEAWDCGHYFVDKQTEIRGGIVPVGHALPGMDVLLLDDAGRPVGGEAVGEIVLKSRYFAMGYWRRPDLTRAAFQPAPDEDGVFLYHTGDLGRMQADGCLFHLGRKDFQVKIRGYRVDVPEVEAALLALDTVAAAAVIDREDEPGEKRLVAYLVPRGVRGPTVGELRRSLAETLPEYMIPSAFVPLAVLPITGTGKVDRRALPPPGHTRPELETEFLPPRTPLEETLADIWAEVLKLDAVGIDDPFLELGGDSLLAMRIASRVLAACGVRVPIPILLEQPTVAKMAERVARIQAAHEELAAIERRLEELAEPAQ